jgi:transcriptional regulator with XRE-family HTH domain
MITPEQCRAARGLLGWTQQVLADKSQTGVVTVRQFELRQNMPRRATLQVIQQALEKAGVHFIREDDHAGAGVRFTKDAMPGLREPPLRS